MTEFEAIFGAKKTEIKETCVLLPFLQKDTLSRFGIDNFSKGKLYGTGTNGSLTLINTGIGPAFNGDAVLYLKDTPCRNVILFGSCGLVKPTRDIVIGTLVSPSKCHSIESFSLMLAKKDHREWLITGPDKRLFEKLSAADKEKSIKEVICATTGSLALEKEYSHILSGKGIHVIDMECSAFFRAAKHTKIKAAALLYVTDIIEEKPYYTKLNKLERARIIQAQERAREIICRVTRRPSAS